jgi:hypothetical protein
MLGVTVVGLVGTVNPPKEPAEGVFGVPVDPTCAHCNRL